jgi:histidyl-tRNA synthetase
VFQIPRGTRDFTPEEMYKHRKVLDHIRTTFQLFGYEEIQTPTFESLELFTAKSGESIIEELYNFTDKGGRKLALRPELTAPVIRFYIDQLQMRPKPLKLFYTNNCFRYDRPQKGRYREFWQAGCEIIGPNTPEAYAELIALAYTIFKNLGLTDLIINIGNLTIINALFKTLGVTNEQKNHLLPLIDKGMFDDIQDALIDFNIPEKQAKHFIMLLETSDIDKIHESIYDSEVKKQLDLTANILKLLHDNFNISQCQLKMSIVRGLEYYQDMVFEIETPQLGAEKQLCGGGVYELLKLFGGRETPTAGFAIGVDRTILAMNTEKILLHPPQPQAYIIPVNKTIIPHALTLAQNLRNHHITTDIDLLRRGVGKALKYANTKQYQYILILGPQEIEQKSVTLRDMKTGKQELISLDKIQTKLSP